MVASIALAQAQFNAGMKRVAARKGAAAGRTVAGVATALTAELQLKTAVKFGQARAGWSPYLIHRGYPISEGPGSAEVSLGRQAGSFTDDSKALRPRVVVLNGVRHLHDINAGNSSQTPAGFIQATLARWGAHLQREADKGI